jgi:uncharacterized protein (DUF58 family)
MLLASSYPLLDVFWSMLEFFLFVVWIWVLILVFSDIFRSRDLSGAAKAAWLIIVLILPLFGVLLYLIIRGHSMEERRANDAADSQAQFDAYVRQSAGGTSTADELADLAKLKAAGTITDEDYEKAKAKVLS